MLEIGMDFPEFSLADDAGVVRSKGDFAGRMFVMFFYPKDGSSG